MRSVEHEPTPGPIEGVATAVAAFLGRVGSASVGEPVRVSSWQEYVDVVGLDGDNLPGAVHGWFLGGGGPCVVAPNAPGLDMTGTLEALEGVTIVCAPDLAAAGVDGEVDRTALADGQRALVAHCEARRDRMAVLDPPRSLSAAEVLAWRADLGIDSAYATLYWPWVRAVLPRAGAPGFQPPSGHVAGLWAANDATRGVFRAPAGLGLDGVLEVEATATAEEYAALNEAGVDAIRAFPGRGIVVWGARTLSSDPEWKYVAVRRYLSYLERSVEQGLGWAVFEPNGQPLWERVRRLVTSFLAREWQSGGLVGSKPEHAFFVRCDETTMTQADLDSGRLVCLVGVAALKPAEFVVLRIGVRTADASPG